MKTKKIVRRGLRVLSLARQAKIQKFWDNRNSEPLAFIPKGIKEQGLSPTEARKANEAFGKFADEYMKRIFRLITRDADKSRRVADNMKVIAVGYGKGHGSKWLRQASKAGFETWWIDVSLVAWMWAAEAMDSQFRDIPQMTPSQYRRPQVKTAEIQSLLADPHMSDLDLGSVEVWYLCRLLNCLSTRSVKIVLQEIGRTTLALGANPLKRGAVVVINALCDQNPVEGGGGGTSIRRSKRMILANLTRGAGRPVQVRYESHYQYFDKLVTAMTIMAKT